MPQAKTKVRLFVDDCLGAGQVLELGRNQHHYVRNVMRQNLGDEITIFNGRDGEWKAAISEATRNLSIISCIEQIRAQKTEPDIWLLFAPLKKTNIDFVIEKATELGASRFIPILTERTVVTRINRDRLMSRAIEAAEQCGRMTLPQIDNSMGLDQVIRRWSSDRNLIVMDETGNGRPVTEALGKLSGDSGTTALPCGILVGPEGGFSASELDGLRKQPFVTTVTAGPRILRAETAALAALACWQAIVGDWQ